MSFSLAFRGVGGGKVCVSRLLLQIKCVSYGVCRKKDGDEEKCVRVIGTTCEVPLFSYLETRYILFLYYLVHMVPG